MIENEYLTFNLVFHCQKDILFCANAEQTVEKLLKRIDSYIE